MHYNLENIDIKKPQLIFIGTKEKVGAYNKRAIGIRWLSGDSELYFINRIDYLYNESELELLALDKVIEIINELVKNSEDEIYIEIFSKSLKNIMNISPYDDKNLNLLLIRCISNMGLFERRGIHIKFTDFGIPPILESKLDDSLNAHILRNDFQNDTLFLSSVSSKQFDRCLFNLVNLKLIEYISIYEEGVKGINKRLISPDDESSVNQLLFTIPGYTKQVDNFKLDCYRRILMVSRDSDLIIAAVNTIEEDNLLFPDSLCYLAALNFNIPIFILDTKDQIWYTKSISERRNIVKAKRLPNLKQYKNVSFYINTYNFDSTWDTIKKLIKE